MGKMKELFIQQMNEQTADMSYAEYQDWLNSQEITGIPNGDTMSDTDEEVYEPLILPEAVMFPSILIDEPTTQAEVESEHDAWWNSLTNEQKEELFKGQEKVFELSIEEMNHDLSFGK